MVFISEVLSEPERLLEVGKLWVDAKRRGVYYIW